MKPVIFDTGPIVAWFCPRDEHHNWARQKLSQLPAGGIIRLGPVSSEIL
jgi:hypothetical protein